MEIKEIELTPFNNGELFKEIMESIGSYDNEQARRTIERINNILNKESIMSLPIQIRKDHELILTTSKPFFAFKFFDTIVDTYKETGDKRHFVMTSNGEVIQETYSD